MSNRNLYILTPRMLLRAYAMGIFPMAESAEATELHWYDPPLRGLIPLDERFHIPSRLRRTISKRPFTVTVNKCFEATMRGCAEPKQGRETTWINAEIIRLYSALHWRGHAHSVEVWDQDNLIGGLYGVSLGAAFFGESMFSRKTDASKIALVHLVTLLKASGYILLDTQFLTNHLSHFGAYEVTRDVYQHLLKDAIAREAQPFPKDPDWAGLGL